MNDLNIFSDGAELPAWVGQLIALIGAAYPNWKCTDLTAVVYFDALQDLDLRDVRDGARACIKDGGEFAPTVAAIRAKAKIAKGHRHEDGCGCYDCVSKLPEGERWNSLNEARQQSLESQAPHIAKALKAAANRALEAGAKRISSTGGF